MKAIVYTEYGTPDRLKLKEVDKPMPGDDEVLVKIYAVSLNRSDWEGVLGRPLYARLGGLFRPSRHILGSDIAGRVEQVGNDVKQFKSGDEVFGDILNTMGGFAEYVSVNEKHLAIKPPTLSFEEASTIPQAGVIALQGIRDSGELRAGRKILINGAGGATGAFAIQLAKMYGAEVTGVDNPSKLEFMRTLGADHVIDYMQKDFTQSGEQYDLILDLIAHRSIFAYPRVLKPNGTYFMVGGAVAIMFQILFFGPWIRRSTGKNIRILVVRPNIKDMLFFTELCETSKIKLFIDRRFQLEQVPEAIQYLGDGHAKGKLVIVVAEK